VLRGSGTVIGQVVNSGGTVDPGDSPGILTVQGGYMQDVNASLRAEIGGSLPGVNHDRLVVTGTAVLGGALQIALIGGFQPTIGTQFTILTAASVTGAFTQVAPCNAFQVSYTPNSVVVTVVGVSLPADLNCDGVVNGADLGVLLAGWGECAGALCPADLNGDGVVNGADLGILLASWS
jgi:hypothetical protein